MEESKGVQKGSSPNTVKKESEEISIKKAIVNDEKQCEEEKKETNNSRVLKRKITEDGSIVERILSEGEASSGFETVSSVEIDDFESMADIDISSDDEVFNIVVQIENELAFKNSDRRSHGKLNNHYTGSDSSARSGSRGKSDYYYGESNKHRRDGNPQDYRKRRNWFDGAKRDDNDRSQRRSVEPDQRSNNRSYKRCRRSGRSRSPDYRNSKRSRVNDAKDGGKFDKVDSLKSNPRRKAYPGNENKFPNDVPKRRHRTASLSSLSDDSGKKKDSPLRVRKRKGSFSKSTSPWRRLNRPNNKSSRKSKEVGGTRNGRWTKKNSPNLQARTKKERTPFLVELEKKLKEAEILKNTNNTPTSTIQETTENPTPVETPLAAPDQTMQQTVNLPPNPPPAMPSLPFNCIGPSNIMFQYSPIPALSVDNLPLVPGPTGLPVHITMTGEQIPHDMDGRRIPVGPNGHYLPVDPTGRLFPHIVSPSNAAVPIHMSEDGVLRLPNQQPVPVGPAHQLPINIDGSVILIGPDSKPLYPCPNLPSGPPVHLVQAEPFFNCSNPPVEPPIYETTPAPSVPAAPLTFKQVKTIPLLSPESTQKEIDSQRGRDEINLLELIQDSSPDINRNDLVQKYRRKAKQKREDFLKCIEIEKNLGVSPSKRGVKRSIPAKMTQKKSSKEGGGSSSGSDMVLDSGDSDHTPIQLEVTTPDTGVSESAATISVNSNFENVPQIICDKESPQVVNLETNLEDQITKKVQKAIKSLYERDFKPPALSRFILTKSSRKATTSERPPNESPLWRNRITLQFLIPNSGNPPEERKSPSPEESSLTFRFQPQKKPSGRVETAKQGKPTCAALREVFTFDFAMQCDLTAETIQALNGKIKEMEKEIARLRNVNANLLDGFRNVQTANEKKSKECKKAFEEIEAKNAEIDALKRAIEEKRV